MLTQFDVFNQNLATFAFIDCNVCAVAVEMKFISSLENHNSRKCSQNRKVDMHLTDTHLLPHDTMFCFYVVSFCLVFNPTFRKCLLESMQCKGFVCKNSSPSSSSHLQQLLCTLPCSNIYCMHSHK